MRNVCWLHGDETGDLIRVYVHGGGENEETGLGGSKGGTEGE